MATYQRTKYVVSRALYAQRFRRVDLSGLATDGAITLPTNAGAEVDAALREIGADPNWVEIARQLAQLRVIGFGGVYLRRDRHDIELIPLYGFSGGLDLPTYQGYFDFVWSITVSMKDLMGSFELPENLLKILAFAASQLDGAAAPTEQSAPPAPGAEIPPVPAGEDAGPIGEQTEISPDQEAALAATSPEVSETQRVRNGAASLLRLICDLSFARTPATGVAAIAMMGAQAPLLEQSNKANGTSLYRADRWGLDVVNTKQYAIIIDGRDLRVSSNVTRSGSLDLGQLRQALPFLAARV